MMLVSPPRHCHKLTQYEARSNSFYNPPLPRVCLSRHTAQTLMSRRLAVSHLDLRCLYMFQFAFIQPVQQVRTLKFETSYAPDWSWCNVASALFDSIDPAMEPP